MIKYYFLLVMIAKLMLWMSGVRRILSMYLSQNQLKILNKQFGIQKWNITLLYQQKVDKFMVMILERWKHLFLLFKLIKNQ
jgi:hypothetical protein